MTKEQSLETGCNKKKTTQIFFFQNLFYSNFILELNLILKQLIDLSFSDLANFYFHNTCRLKQGRYFSL